ncbi:MULTISPECIES: hypothetical protein [Streptomyces]|jgi:hypothetical protein|uniref:hypothetical protein n=1 Tax=Streptomyces TaxID=1883 RepID=UPI00130282FF|nr:MULTISPECIES: hypothetical protein [Streptomyces]MDN5384147.1 hypothetical protein [Streptomyces sp. LB8]
MSRTKPPDAQDEGEARGDHGGGPVAVQGEPEQRRGHQYGGRADRGAQQPVAAAVSPKCRVGQVNQASLMPLFVPLSSGGDHFSK